MRYLYLDNIRGFSNQIIPLKQTNFLVGENSTGKSSFLTLIHLLNTTEYWVNPSFYNKDKKEYISFSDLVSAWGVDKKKFRVGMFHTVTDKKENVQFTCHLHEFISEDNVPVISKITRVNGKKITKISFEKSGTKFSIDDFNESIDCEEDAIKIFLNLSNTDDEVGRYTKFPKGFPKDAPLPLINSVIKGLTKGEAPKDLSFEFELPMGAGVNVAWIAPIRSKPKRTYESVHIGYSPEGEHAPTILRKTLRKKLRANSNSKNFTERLSEFGEASGLFETIFAHSFGSGRNNPFELIVKFQGAELNINNVGYGVSQVLPLIVEFLSTERRRIFAVQQPEVHLHPRAQAALGGLIYELTKQQNHIFFIETHSDYLIDRYRIGMHSDKKPTDSQVIFFERTASGNKAYPIAIHPSGAYPSEQPKKFREFFLKEELKLLEV